MAKTNFNSNLKNQWLKTINYFKNHFILNNIFHFDYSLVTINNFATLFFILASRIFTLASRIFTLASRIFTLASFFLPLSSLFLPLYSQIYAHKNQSFIRNLTKVIALFFAKY